MVNPQNIVWDKRVCLCIYTIDIIVLGVFMQPKKSFALVDYDICDPKKCNPDEGICAAVAACEHKVIKQLD